jgi:N-acetylglucosaminyldiphosphoundecaprenol N-acetyl-beta-D-mannosaminyltransferase
MIQSATPSLHLPKFSFGQVTCSPHSISNLLEELRVLLSDKSLQPRTILCINAHIYNLACRDAQLRDCLRRSRLTLADGMAVVWAARLLGKKMAERCNMTEAYHAFLKERDMPANRAILVGCSEAEAATAARKASEQSNHCRIVASYSGYLTSSDYEKIFSNHRDIDFVFLGMGTPRTEFTTELAAKTCPNAIVWGIGGGTVRIDAGTMAEAPVIWRRLGLQWLHRLASEPAALWRRYLFGNPLFVARMLSCAISDKFKSDRR